MGLSPVDLLRAFAVLARVVGQMLVPNGLAPRSLCPLAPPASLMSERLGNAAATQTPSQCFLWVGDGCQLLFPTWLGPVSDSSIHRELREPLRKAPLVRGDTPEITRGASPFPWVNPDQTDLTWSLASPVWSCPDSACHDFSATQGPQQPPGPPALPEPPPESSLPPSPLSGGSTSRRCHL